MKRALAVLAAVACSHPAAHPRDPDDERAGATTATSFHDFDYWKSSGSFESGDTVDWIRIDLPPDPGTIDVTVDSDQRILGEIYAADGAELAKLPAKVVAKAIIYVRVTGTAGSYVVRAQRMPPEGVPKYTGKDCDREHFDPDHPRCAGKCDFKNPDENNQDCCLLWWEKCTKRVSDSCNTHTIWWVGAQLQAAIGLDKGVHGHPRAVLHLTEREPKAESDWVEKRRGRQVELRAVTIEATRSAWELVEPTAHDLEWIRKHAKTIEVFVPSHCPRR